MTTNTQHTPGPWQTGAGACHTVFAAYKVDGHQRQIAHCATQSGRVDYDSTESFANARLIAAAPDMLDSLGLALAALGDATFQLEKVGGDLSLIRGTANDIGATIAKATGAQS